MGDVIEEFASDHATVVVGSVIDPEMTEGEVRVTVIATGVERAAVSRAQQPNATATPAEVTSISKPKAKPSAVAEIPPEPSAAPAPVAAEPAQKPAPKAAEIDYSHLERPTMMRNKQPEAENAGIDSKETDADYLDIPAFLRRQAD